MVSLVVLIHVTSLVAGHVPEAHGARSWRHLLSLMDLHFHNAGLNAFHRLASRPISRQRIKRRNGFPVGVSRLQDASIRMRER